MEGVIVKFDVYQLRWGTLSSIYSGLTIAGLSLGRLEEGAFRKLSQHEWMPLIESEA